MFEATHGTAPKYADKDVINPGSVILSGVMLFDFLGWTEAARLIESSMEKTIQQKFVTYDFERQMQGATKAKTSEFATRMIENMGSSQEVAMITGGNATVFVTNMDASLKFYNEFLGWKIASHYGDHWLRSKQDPSRSGCIRSRISPAAWRHRVDHDRAGH